MKVAIVGTGYVGLVTGVCLAEVGHDVCCVDTNQQKIDMLNGGKVPIYEPGLDILIARNVEHERLVFTTELAKALAEVEIVFIAVGTPQGEDGSADLQYVESVAREIGKLSDHNLTVVVKSTVPVGTCARVEKVINDELAQRKAEIKIVVASNPEFLKEGDAIDDFMKPDRVVVGVEDADAKEQFRDLYRPFVLDDPGRLLIMDRYSSELTKYGANAMLATRISFMNEMSRLCDRVGANIDHVRSGMGSDSRIGKKFLFAGPGYGGSCFPKDVKALISTGDQYGTSLEVLKAVSATNIRQKEYVAEKIKAHFGSLKGKRIAVWGLAFKPGTDDVREAPAFTLVRYLLEHGADVVAHDPQATKTFADEFGQADRLSYAKSAYAACQNADAVVLMTEWSEYKRPNWAKLGSFLQQKVVFDFRNQYQFERLKPMGYTYYCIGRPDSVTKDPNL